jgi:eukaryotic-like serine/threonine-protein kinase
MNERRLDSKSDTVRDPGVQRPVRVEIDEPELASTSFGRYDPGEIIGEGGMGKVACCHDRPIGREVAMKVLPPRAASSPTAQARFLREARIQGQLEHPCIVPVYDLGSTPDGCPFFTMKRVRGVTLREVVARLADGEPAAQALYTQRKLLDAFSRVCLAVDAAHRRGVTHRDIKPENIMLGDFGEVYLLDWGVAGLQGSQSSSNPPIAIEDEEGHLTRAGQTLGTPRYMAPEQRQGIANAASDIYALGCVLYEILTFTHIRDQRPEAEAKVPPELITICRRAAAEAAEERYEDARQLHAVVDRFLEGDRDMELRRRLAGEHASRAEKAASRALSSRDSDREARGLALAEAGRALALDPENDTAARTLFRLLAEPPAEIPPAATETWNQERDRATLRAFRTAAIAWSAVPAFFVLLPWMGIRDGWTVAAVFAVQIAAVAVLASAKLWLGISRRVGLLLPIVAVTAAGASMSVIFGSLVLVPALMAIAGASFAMHISRPARPLLAACMSAVFLISLTLEWFGVVAPSYATVGNAIHILPRAVELPEIPAMFFLIASSVALIVCAIFFFGSFREALFEAERRLHLQTWQLRQLIGREVASPSDTH